MTTPQQPLTSPHFLMTTLAAHTVTIGEGPHQRPMVPLEAAQALLMEVINTSLASDKPLETLVDFGTKIIGTLPDGRRPLKDVNTSGKQLESLQQGRVLTLDLANDNNRTGHYVEVERGGDGNVYKEVSVQIMDKDGNSVGDVLIGLSAKLEPIVGITTDGDGMGDKNVLVYPLRPAEEAVEVDVHNSRAYREGLVQSSLRQANRG